MKLPQRSKKKISKIRRLLAVHISFNVDKCKFKVKLSNNFLEKYKQQDKEVPIYNKRCMYGNYYPDF